MEKDLKICKKAFCGKLATACGRGVNIKILICSDRLALGFTTLLFIGTQITSCGLNDIDYVFKLIIQAFIN